MYKPELPPEVLAILTPATEAIREEVVHGVSLVTGRKVNRAGKVAARANGSSNYGPGFEHIMSEVFGRALLAEIRATGPGAVDRDDSVVREYGEYDVRQADNVVSLPGPAKTDDDDDDDESEESTCNTYTCCGYCHDCDTCHGDGRDYTRDIGGGRYRYCREHDHECDD